MSDAPALAGVHYVEDLDSAGDFEKKHTPYIECTRDDDTVIVKVAVGHWVGHPNMPDHFIEWIEILAQGAPVARFDMAAVAVNPTLTCTLTVDSGTEIAALESCNLHGVWKAVTVAP